jgi:hypothetical protein
MKTVCALLPLLLAAAIACAADGDAGQDSGEWAEASDSDLRRELRHVERELDAFRELEKDLARSERQSANTARARVIDELQQVMIDAVVRREEIVGLEHTIIRHGQPPSAPTAAAEVGTPNANKETRRRMRKGTSTKSDAFLRLAWMQQQVMGGERIYRPAIERQPGAFEQYTLLVKEFGSALQEEYDGILDEMMRRERMVAPADADSTAQTP